MAETHNIGFISFRFAGTDGVSLETAKWATVLENMGYNCFFMAGELDTPEEKSFIDKKLHFQEEEIKEIYDLCFSQQQRERSVTDRIFQVKEHLKDKIYSFLNTYKINMLISQNALAIPLNIPLGIALTEVIVETNIPVIAHHHDFFWERKRFLINCVWDYFNMCYPPHLNNVEHIVINSSAQNQLALRKGISSTLIPNVMNFEFGPPPLDDYNVHVRKDLGIAEDELFILQPTRVVQRKGIEHAIELLAQIKQKSVLVISHASGDEGYEYQIRLQKYARVMNTRTIFVDEIIQETRGTTKDGRRIYSLEDVYPHADLITYPSLIEGFGNAFLEALWFRKPILVNNYSIYSTDIKPKGFKVIEMDGFLSDETVKQTERILEDKNFAREMAEYNYSLALQHYSYQILRSQLRAVITRHWGNDSLGKI